MMAPQASPPKVVSVSEIRQIRHLHGAIGWPRISARYNDFRC